MSDMNHLRWDLHQIDRLRYRKNRYRQAECWFLLYISVTSNLLWITMHTEPLWFIFPYLWPKLISLLFHVPWPWKWALRGFWERWLRLQCQIVKIQNALISIKFCIGGFSGSLITNQILFLENSKWRHKWQQFFPKVSLI